MCIKQAVANGTLLTTTAPEELAKLGCDKVKRAWEEIAKREKRTVVSPARFQFEGLVD